MQSQWIAISEPAGDEWIAYSREMPSAIMRGSTRGQALANLEQLSALLLSAGIGGVDVADHDTLPDLSTEEVAFI